MKNILRLSRWHRWLGITVALFVLMLAVTGLLLNHTEPLRLDKKYVDSEWLLDWYGIQPQHSPVSYPAGRHWVTQVNGQLYYDDKLLARGVDQLVGAVRLGRFIVVAADTDLYLLLDDGRLVEKLDGVEGVPSGMRAIGLDAQGVLIIRAAHDVYSVDDLDTLEWQHTSAEQVEWSESAQPPAAHMDTVLKLYRGSGLAFERVLLDLHSGRIAGDFGVLLIDLVAVLFCGLGITGMIMWFRGY